MAKNQSQAVTDETDDYSFDDSAASHADDIANRIDQSQAYVGAFSKAWAGESSKGTKLIHFEFDAPGGGEASFDLYTKKKDPDTGEWKTIFGNNFVQAIMAVLNLKGLKGVPGKIMKYDEAENKRVEADGTVYPELCGKNIGLVLQKELYTKGNGSDGFRMNLYGVFHADSRLTASEIKAGAKKPEKLERLLRGLKNKDSRTKTTEEPAQTSLGVAAGEGGY